MSAPGWSPNSLPPAGPVARQKASLRVGQRARKLGTANQTGIIRYVGELDGRPGVWVGVEWDELGQGDTTGELNGRRYFSCSHRGQKVGNAASFVRESELFVAGAGVQRHAGQGLCTRADAPPARRRAHGARREHAPGCGARRGRVRLVSEAQKCVRLLHSMHTRMRTLS